ncbi:MAG: flippase-like domain-containing protein [Clostridiales bacterium]|jgi:uncharacterized protein (TIRG00374 family)|nr:flippase-like domain-containing protein [Clostridiales bacterium]
MDDKLIPILTGKRQDKKFSFNKASRTALLVVSFFVAIYVFVVSFLSGESVPLTAYWSLVKQNVGWLYIAVLLFIAVVFLETCRYTVLIRMTIKQFKPILAFRTAMIGRFYSAVTPFLNGGQGMQTNVLAQAKTGRASAFSIPFSQVFLKTLVWNLILMFFFIFNKQGITGMKWWAFAGLIVNGIYPVLFFVFSINEKAAKKIIAGLLKAGAYLKLVKNYDSALSASWSFLEDLSISVKNITKNLKGFLLLLLLYAAEFMALMSIPFFLFRSVGESVTYTYMLVSYMYIYLSSLYVPIPGAAGAYEIYFFTMYSGLVTNNMTYWLMLTMRFFTYFFYIICGYVILLVDSVVKRVRGRQKLKSLIAEHTAERPQEEAEIPSEAESLIPKDESQTLLP